MASETAPLMDNIADEYEAPGQFGHAPGDRPDWSRITQALEAAIGTLREQLALQRERVGMADRRAELAERRADRAEAALAAELTRLDALQRRLAAAEAAASRLQAERAGADAFAQEAHQAADALRQADKARQDRNSRLMPLGTIVIGAGLGALVGSQWDDPVDGALIGGVGGSLLDELLLLVSGGRHRGA